VSIVTFEKRLKTEFKRLQLTQHQAARLLSVSPRTIWGWLHGEEPMIITQEAVIARLANAKRIARRHLEKHHD
jgi:transcriptional regulator with XRE-family HTH domain